MTRLVVFLMFLEIFNNESVNLTFKFKLEYKLGGFNTWQLVPDITDYKLEFMTPKFKFGWNSAHRDFRVCQILVW